MLIFGIDTSGDDTSASVVESGTRIVSNIISSQTEIHKQYGGIVPELASRRHIEMIWPVVDEAMKGAGLAYADLACIAVCHGPGLIGSLLVGCSFAKALCYAKEVPLVAVNHLEGHIFSPFPYLFGCYGYRPRSAIAPGDGYPGQRFSRTHARAGE